MKLLERKISCYGENTTEKTKKRKDSQLIDIKIQLSPLKCRRQMPTM